MVALAKALSLKQDAFLKFVVTTHNIHEAKFDSKIAHILSVLRNNGLCMDVGARRLPDLPLFSEHVHDTINREKSFFGNDPIASELRAIMVNCLKQSDRLYDMNQSKVKILMSNVPDRAAALSFLRSPLGIAIVNLTINISAINKV